MFSGPHQSSTNMHAKKKQPCAWCLEWCCPGRSAWFSKLFVAAIVLFSIFALVFAMWALYNADYNISRTVYTSSAAIGYYPSNHILAGALPLIMTLPNNMINYLGGATYDIDCGSSGHIVKIQPGTIPTTWPGGATQFVCDAAGGGVSFRVISSFPPLIRVTASNDVTFS